MTERPTPDLPILETRVYRGANVWSYDKAIHLVVDLGSLEEFPTNTLPGLHRRPARSCCPACASTPARAAAAAASSSGSTRAPGSGHVAEHVALALQQEVGHDIRRGKTRQVKGQHGPLQRHLRVRRRAGRPRRRAGSPYAWSTTWSRPTRSSTGTQELRGVHPARRAHRVRPLDPGDPRRGGLPRHPVDPAQPALPGAARPGRAPKRIRATMTSATSAIAVDIASDKDLTTRLLGAAGLPVPKQESVRTADQAVARRRADRLPGRGQAARRQPRPRRLPRPAGRRRRPRGVPDRQGPVPARLGDRRVLRHRQGLPLPGHRRPDRRDRRAGARARRSATAASTVERAGRR